MYEIIERALDITTAGELVDIWNGYCLENRYTDQIIETMDRFDEIADGLTPTEILEKFRDIDPNDPYFVLTIYGGESFTDPAGYIYLSDLVDHIANNWGTWGRNSSMFWAVRDWEYYEQIARLFEIADEIDAEQIESEPDAEQIDALKAERADILDIMGV